jgi:radical SAM superfamily enzyme YgiQ (UPF0313 family)
LSSHTRRHSADSARKNRLAGERGVYLKKWGDRLPVALLYPNRYRAGMASLGMQLVYHQLNECETIVCERIFLPDDDSSPVSMESGRPLDNFALVLCSISFEQDYVNLVRLLLDGGIAALSEQRGERIEPGAPLVVGGGVALSMNPEPLAPFFDLLLIGEAEVLLPPLLTILSEPLGSRREFLGRSLVLGAGFYVPRRYTPSYDGAGRFVGMQADGGAPARVKRVYADETQVTGRSQLLSPDAEFADLYMVELGRGCSRGCRFCTAGFVLRPPRLWGEQTVAAALADCPADVSRVGLLGMEMTGEETIETISEHMLADDRALSFSSLRADRISGRLLALLGKTRPKSLAIAPDGASQRLRRVINKGLSEADIISAGEHLAAAGLYRLKLYLMIGLPTETAADIDEFLGLLGRLREAMNAIGRSHGRLCELIVSATSFVPKPWTPFQYHPFGSPEQPAQGESISADRAVSLLKKRTAQLKKGITALANVTLKTDKVEDALWQAVLARGDRRLAPVLLDMAASGISSKRAMKQHGVSADLFATRHYRDDDALPWQIIDQGINDSYLFDEYSKAILARESRPCEPPHCRRCGVCGRPPDN